MIPLDSAERGTLGHLDDVVRSFKENLPKDECYAKYITTILMANLKPQTAYRAFVRGAALTDEEIAMYLERLASLDTTGFAASVAERLVDTINVARRESERLREDLVAAIDKNRQLFKDLQTGMFEYPDPEENDE